MTDPFLEIEHKFVINPEEFDRSRFFAQMQGLQPNSTTEQEVNDHYFLANKVPGFVYRHRYDSELQHLTLKSWEKSSQIRTEINLDLGQHKGNQAETVEAFLGVLDVFFDAPIKKEIKVFHFDKVEAVYYRASYLERVIDCIEFEAVSYDSVEEAEQTLSAFEAQAGFANLTPSDDSLFELIVIPQMPDGIMQRVEKWMHQ